MATHRSYTEKIQEGIRWARSYFGIRLTGTIALHHDLIAEGANDAIKSRSAKYSNVDAYPYIGGNVNLERFPNDTDATYRDRLMHAFSIWQQAGTKQGLERAFDYFGFAGVLVYEDKDWLRPPKPYWSQFWVWFPSGSHSVTTSTTVYGAGAGTYGSGSLYGISGITAELVEGLRRLVRKWKRSASICREFIFETGGITYGAGGHTYGDGSLYGGSQAIIGAN